MREGGDACRSGDGRGPPMSVLVTGSGGHLGSVLLPRARDAFGAAWGTVSLGGRRPPDQEVLAVDLREPAALVERVLVERPRTIVHLAAISRVADAWRDPIRAHEVNVLSTAELTALAGRVGARLVLASTEMVFDGRGAPYDEAATPHPRTQYGRTKLAAESHVLGYRQGVVVRLPLLLGIPPLAPAGGHLAELAHAFAKGPPARLFEDEYRTPMSLANAADALIKIAGAPGLTGIVHVAGIERVSRLELGLRWAKSLGVVPRYEAVRAADLELPEPRPPDLSMTTGRYQAYFGALPSQALDDALADCASDLRRHQQAPDGPAPVEQG